MKKILFTLAALSLASVSFAQDFGFGGDMGGSDDFEGGSFEESSAPAVTISGEVGAETRAWLGTVNEEKGKFDTTHYDGAYDLSKTKMDAGAYANLELNYAGDYTDANLKLKLDSETLSEYPEDVIDEVYANGSFKEGKFQLKAGKMKEVWGKGDKVHVLDNFNANDYSDFIFPDYIDRRIGEVMFKATANLSWDYNLKLEGIFTPWMTADRFASEGFLVPAKQKQLTSIVKGVLAEQAAATYASGNPSAIAKGVMELSDFSTDDLYKDNTKSLKYSQGGLRLTGTMGGIDWGASYYYGHYKQPSANLENFAVYSKKKDIKAGAFAKYKAGVVQGILASEEAKGFAQLYGVDLNDSDAVYNFAYTNQAALGQQIFNEATVNGAVDGELEKNGYTLKNALPALAYDQVQVFGLEAAFVLWKLNTRWEAAYNLTEDIAGDNPWIKNNSVSWVAGFDIDLPIHNLNLNVQETGSYILKSDKIKNNKITVGSLKGNAIEIPIETADVNYNSDGKYISNKIIALLSDKWLNEKLTTEVQGIYCIEDKGYMVAPKIEYNVSEGLTFGLRGVYLHCDNENGEFYNFTADSENNDKAFIELTAKYQF